jgi:hypothetical protein
MKTARAVAVLVAVSSIACAGGESGSARGSGLKAALLPATEQAHVYEAAVRASYELDDPSLSLSLDARLLPRKTGLLPEGRVADSVVAELRQRGVIKGDCEPPLQSGLGPPHCAAARPGYVIRFSPVFSLGADSVQVYLYSQKFDTPNSEPSQSMRFERAYEVARRGDAWKAVREGPVKKEIRGEKP